MSNWNLALNVLQALPSKREALSIIKTPFTVIYITKDASPVVTSNFNQLCTIFNPIMVVEPDFKATFPENMNRLFKLMQDTPHSYFVNDLSNPDSFSTIKARLDRQQTPFILPTEVTDNKRRFLNNNTGMDMILKGLEIDTLKFIILSKQGGISVNDQHLTRINLSSLNIPRTAPNRLMKHVLNNVSLLSSGYMIKDGQSNIISEIINPVESTFVRQGVPVHKYHGLSKINLDKLKSLLEYAFKRKLKPKYFEQLAEKDSTLYVAGDYKGVIIYTIENGYTYLDKFAVGDLQGVGLGDLLWDGRKCFWRSRQGNFINNWYFEKADGYVKCGHWVLFWRGYTMKEMEELKEIVLEMEASFE